MISEQPNLAARLRDRIKRDGPLSFHDWMQAALYDEHDGYYRRADRLRQGRTGDYRTLPETSPLFGATFAKYFARCHAELGAPARWTILEVGAGRGDFAHAALTTLQRNYPDVFKATRYLIDELGDEARVAAQIKLQSFSACVQFCSLTDLTSFAGIIFSNELIDAFPVHRVISERGEWRELAVEINEANEFAWTTLSIEPRVTEYCEQINLSLQDGQIYEVNLAAEDFIVRAASLINHGYLITVDYGAEREELLSAAHRFNGTLRSFHRHRMIDDALSHPGQKDLTTTIDWTQVAATGSRAGLESFRFQRLDQFLIDEGLLDQISDYTTNLQDNAEVAMRNAAARQLIMPDGMAAHFQVCVQRRANQAPHIFTDLLKN